MPEQPSPRRRLFLAVLCATGIIGIFLRLPTELFKPDTAPLHALADLHLVQKYTDEGFDEHLYTVYVDALAKVGPAAYSDLVDKYIDIQKGLTGSILPPTRFLYIFVSYLWHQLFGGSSLTAVRAIASLFSILTLIVSTGFAWRLGGRAAGLAVAALIAVAPTQLHMSQHGLVDGFFTFWALSCLWLLWENLNRPGSTKLLIGYGLVLGCLVVTKENSFFVFVAVVTLLFLNRWLKFGVVTRELIVCTVVAPLLAVVVLIFLAGGLGILITSYKLSVGKNYQLAFAILTGDGPWYRYLVDLLLVSPIPLLLAIGTILTLNRAAKPDLFLGIFIGVTYLIMCNIKYGMNLRYANMWDMPIRYLAFRQIVFLAGRSRGYRTAIVSSAVGLTALIELRQYIVLFVQFPLYEIVSEGLLRAVHILKTPRGH